MKIYESLRIYSTGDKAEESIIYYYINHIYSLFYIERECGVVCRYNAIFKTKEIKEE
jgi:hypothetical protein